MELRRALADTTVLSLDVGNFVGNATCASVQNAIASGAPLYMRVLLTPGAATRLLGDDTFLPESSGVVAAAPSANSRGALTWVTVPVPVTVTVTVTSAFHHRPLLVIVLVVVHYLIQTIGKPRM
jgi:hypothetical protein